MHSMEEQGDEFYDRLDSSYPTDDDYGTEVKIIFSLDLLPLDVI